MYYIVTRNGEIPRGFDTSMDAIHWAINHLDLSDRYLRIEKEGVMQWRV